VLASIDFYDQPSSGAIEVRDEWPQLVLASELETVELLAAKMAP
jgi:hypothetical protein